MAASREVQAIAGLRTAVGLVTYAAPRLAGRLFGLDPGGNPQLPYVARLFGGRDVALAAGALASEGEAQRRWLQIGAAVDAADLAAALLSYRDGEIGPLTAVLLTAAPLSAIALGVAALRA